MIDKPTIMIRIAEYNPDSIQIYTYACKIVCERPKKHNISLTILNKLSIYNM